VASAELADTWMNEIATHGMILANGMVPRGLGVGCHVAPCLWCLKSYGVRGDRTPDLPPKVERLRKEWATTSLQHVSY
jgi:hypothetical protein